MIGFLWLGKRRFQFFQGRPQSGLYGSQGQMQDFCNFTQGQILPVPQKDDLPHIFRQTAHKLP